MKRMNTKRYFGLAVWPALSLAALLAIILARKKRRCAETGTNNCRDITPVSVEKKAAILHEMAARKRIGT